MVARFPLCLKLNGLIGKLFNKCLDEQLWLAEALLNVIDPKLSGDKVLDIEHFIDSHVCMVRAHLGHVLGEQRIDEVNENNCSACIRTPLLRRWAQLAQVLHAAIGFCVVPMPA